MRNAGKFPPINIPDVQPQNRALEIKIDEQDGGFENLEVTLIKIDGIISNYLENVIQPSVKDNDRLIPVPVLFSDPERWKTIRKDGFLRDPKNDKQQTPLVVLHRDGIRRNELTNPSNKYMHMSHEAQWNNRVGYDRFTVQNGIRPSKKFMNVIIPDYIDLTYTIILWTEYQEQMNGLIEQINVENDEYWGVPNQYKFRVKIENYDNEMDLPAEGDRVIRTIFSMKVSGYLVPERMVRNFNISPTIQKSFSAKKVVAFVETVQMNSTKSSE